MAYFRWDGGLRSAALPLVAIAASLACAACGGGGSSGGRDEQRGVYVRAPRHHLGENSFSTAETGYDDAWGIGSPKGFELAGAPEFGTDQYARADAYGARGRDELRRRHHRRPRELDEHR